MSDGLFSPGEYSDRITESVSLVLGPSSQLPDGVFNEIVSIICQEFPAGGDPSIIRARINALILAGAAGNLDTGSGGDSSPDPLVVSYVVPAGNYVLNDLLISIPKPAGGYRNFTLIQSTGDRPANQWVFKYGAESWTFTAVAVASVPALLLNFNITDGRAVAAVGLVIQTGSTGSCFPAPDVIEYRANGVFNSAAGMQMVGIWT